MPLELLTIKDLQQFKNELIAELKNMLKLYESREPKKLLKTREVCRLLRVSEGTLQNLRRNNTVCFLKIGGILYYRYEDIERLMKRGK
jgi:hypothetical protein